MPFLGYLWRLDADWKACRTEVPYCRKLPSEYVWESVRFTTQPLETPADDEALWPVIKNLRPAETMMFASDYPHWDFDEPTHTLQAAPRGSPRRGGLENAAKLFASRPGGRMSDDGPRELRVAASDVPAPGRIRSSRSATTASD